MVKEIKPVDSGESAVLLVEDKLEGCWTAHQLCFQEDQEMRRWSGELSVPVPLL